MFSVVFRCFPYSNVFLFRTPTFPMFPTVFRRLSALQCFPYFDISKILLFHSIPSPCSNIFRHFPYFYRCRTFSEPLWTHYHHGIFLVTSWTLFRKHHNLGSIMDSLWMQKHLHQTSSIMDSLLHMTFYILPFIYYSIDICPL